MTLIQGEKKKLCVSKLAALPTDPCFNAVFIFATKVGASVSANGSSNVFLLRWAKCFRNELLFTAT